jgi:tetratricopeptide (TPR) repeat protein
LQDPTDAAALYNLALVMDGRGHCEEAVRLYRQALHWCPLDRDAHLNLAHVLRRRGLFRPAAVHYGVAAALLSEQGRGKRERRERQDRRGRQERAKRRRCAGACEQRVSLSDWAGGYGSSASGSGSASDSPSDSASDSDRSLEI